MDNEKENIITKRLDISVDINAARLLLRVAGYYKEENWTDDEVFAAALESSYYYGVIKATNPEDDKNIFGGYLN